MSYVLGFVVPVPIASKDKYVALAARAAPLFKEYGALRLVEAWGDDIPDGTQTDFRRAVQARPDEAVVFSWIVWPDRETYLAASKKMMEDDRMKGHEMPFDGKRMIFGGFLPVFDTEED